MYKTSDPKCEISILIYMMLHSWIAAKATFFLSYVVLSELVTPGHMIAW